MTLFLRDKRGRSVVDIELYINNEYESDGTKRTFVELHSFVDIDYYTDLLLQNLYRKHEMQHDFSEIQELRGWMWEQYFMVKDNNGSEEDLQDIRTYVKTYLLTIGNKYDLYYVED